MKYNSSRPSKKPPQNKSVRRHKHARRHDGTGRPAAAYRQKGNIGQLSSDFYAHEDWYESTGPSDLRVIVQSPGKGFVHAVTADEVRERLAQLPARFRQRMDVLQLSCMTRKRVLFPCYGMQWGANVYLYPIEESLVETYVNPPTPQQLIEARMYGGQWRQDGQQWLLSWTPDTIRDFYLNNVLIHEVGHVNDDRNSNFNARERFANWFAIEYGYRASRGRVVVGR